MSSHHPVSFLASSAADEWCLAAPAGPACAKFGQKMCKLALPLTVRTAGSKFDRLTKGCASFQETFSRGQFGPHPTKWHALLPMTASHGPCGTSQFPMLNSRLTPTRVTGCSPSPQLQTGRAHRELPRRNPHELDPAKGLANLYVSHLGPLGSNRGSGLWEDGERQRKEEDPGERP